MNQGRFAVVRSTTYIYVVLRTSYPAVEGTVMYAAVVTSFDAPPAYLEFSSPVPAGPDQVLVDVVASGLHRRVRSQADGSHYTSTGGVPRGAGGAGGARPPRRGV